VIPAFEEGGKIAGDISAACGFLDRHDMEGEIIVVDDGSGDNTSSAAGEVEVGGGVSLRVIRYEQHRGKGYAVRRGMAETKGEYVMFADSGCCVPYENALRGLELLRSGACEIAHGSRKLGESRIFRGQSLYRRICARFFRAAVDMLTGIGRELTDTQCGFKMYRGDVGRELYGKCVTDGFMLDVEVILRARRQGRVIKEFPVEWTCDRDSRLSPTRSFWGVVRELTTIRRIPGEDEQRRPFSG